MCVSHLHRFLCARVTFLLLFFSRRAPIVGIQFDAVVTGISKLKDRGIIGADQMEVVVTEVGWPTGKNSPCMTDAQQHEKRRRDVCVYTSYVFARRNSLTLAVVVQHG